MTQQPEFVHAPQYPDNYDVSRTEGGFSATGPLFVPHELNPGQTETVSTGVSVYDPDEVKEMLGFRASVPAVIEAGGKSLMVADLRPYARVADGFRYISRQHGRSIGFNADMLLVSAREWMASDGRRGSKALRTDEPVMFGRRDRTIGHRFELPPTVSGEHFGMTFRSGKGLEITDLYSTNGTRVTWSPYDVQPDRTNRVVQRLRHDVRYDAPDSRAPYGYFQGLPILGRQSPRISGGVYLGGSSREAVAVMTGDPRLETTYRHCVAQTSGRQLLSRAILGERRPLLGRLEAVKDDVRAAMRYDADAVATVSAPYRGDRLASLGEFIGRGVGVCRHQSLLAGYFMERMLAEGRLDGVRAKVERNTIPEFGGSHGWAVLEGRDGTEYVVDPARDFVGTKQEARQMPGAWDYYLPLK